MAAKISTPFTLASAWEAADAYKDGMDRTDAVLLALADGRIALSTQVLNTSARYYLADGAPGIVFVDGFANNNGGAAGDILIAQAGPSTTGEVSAYGAWELCARSGETFPDMFANRAFRLWKDPFGRELRYVMRPQETDGFQGNESVSSGYLQKLPPSYAWELEPSLIPSYRRPASGATSVVVDVSTAYTIDVDTSSMTSRSYSLGLYTLATTNAFVGGRDNAPDTGVTTVVVRVSPGDSITFASGTCVSQIGYRLIAPTVNYINGATQSTILSFVVPSGINMLNFEFPSGEAACIMTASAA